MFGIKQSRLIKSLDALQVTRCSYYQLQEMPLEKRRCDCKYLREDDTNVEMGEYGNCCPEISLAYLLLKELSEEEYLDLAKRAGVIVG